MKKDMNQAVDTQRREFMRDSISASVTAAVAASLPVNALAVEEETAAVKKQQGYHLTNHILEYYKSAAS
mgnify:CR=1 FL=1